MDNSENDSSIWEIKTIVDFIQNNYIQIQPNKNVNANINENVKANVKAILKKKRKHDKK